MLDLCLVTLHLMKIQEKRGHSWHSVSAEIRGRGLLLTGQEGLLEDVVPQENMLSSISQPSTFWLQKVRRKEGKPRWEREIRGEREDSIRCQLLGWTPPSLLWDSAAWLTAIFPLQSHPISLFPSICHVVARPLTVLMVHVPNVEHRPSMVSLTLPTASSLLLPLCALMVAIMSH